MTTKIGDLFFDVYADVSRAAKNIDDFAGKVVGAGTAAAKAIGETIANAVGIAVGATSLLVASTLSAGVAYNTLGQSATAAFSTVYGGAQNAYDILSQISELDLETPFRSDALVGVARTLAGFGVAKNDIVGITAALSEATAAMGLGSDALHRMAIAFGQIQSRGKLAGDEARQLANYGIDAYGLLAEELGMSVAAVRELGQESKLTADIVIPTLMNAIENRFGGAIENLANTAAGQAEILGSVFRGVGSALVEPFIGFSTGGAFVEAMKLIHAELEGMIQVTETGAFALQGFLSPLTPIVNDLADGFLRLTTQAADFLSGLDASSMRTLIDSLEGMGPVIAAIGAGLLTMFAQAIPFIGRFAAGFNPIVVALTVLAASSDTVREALGNAFTRIWEAIQPLIPGVKELVANLLGIAEAAVPIVLDVLVTAFEALAPAVSEAVNAVNSLLESLGPTFIALLKAAAEVLKLLADIIGGIPADIALMVAALYALDVLLPALTVGLVANTTAVAGAGGAAALAATQFGILATAIGIAMAAVGSYQSLSAGITGDMDYLNRDVAFYEKPFQWAARFGYGLGGGDRTLIAETAEVNRLLDEGKIAGEAFAESMAESGLRMADFSKAAAEQGLEFEALSYAMIAYREILDAVEAKNREAAASSSNVFEARLARSYRDGIQEVNEVLDEQIDLLKELEHAASDAWAEVDMLSRAGADSIVDDFLLGLTDSARELTEALAEPAGALRDLAVNSALNSVGQDALKVVNLLSREYGMSMADIVSYFDERGLAGVIAALGQVTERTAQTVDPLVAKYSQLGATADQLRDAISRLENQRTSALEAQIDAVTAALDRAQEAAEAARKAFDAYFQAGAGGLQGAIDKLVLDIPSIGDQIEEGLRRGGPQGEAAVRQALGQVGTALGNIFEQGLADGLSAEQIIALLGPVYGSIEQEISGAMNRISSLDWSEGFTPAVANELQAMLAGILDPGQINALFSGITSADSAVSGLQAQLNSLQAQLRVKVEFTPEQVQAAISEIQAEVVTTAVITQEAAQLVYDEIQSVFDDEDLKAAVDKAVITQDILDAAKQAEEQLSLVFKSALSFNSEELHEVAKLVSTEFYAAFNQNLQELRNQRAREYGFDDYGDMVSALGPTVASATVGGTTISQTINNDIKVDGAQTPTATASEIIAASSAAAGSGGMYDPSKYNPNRIGTGPR